MDETPLLELRNLRTWFRGDEGIAKAVDGVSLSLAGGRILGLVGESGCGKSVTALSIMRLVPDPPGRIVGGEILFRGENLLDLSEPRMRAVRGKDIAMVFQEPMSSLNPVLTVGEQIVEAILAHQRRAPSEARQLAIEMLDRVGIDAPASRIGDYPHQMSGGMRQRVMIAMALSCSPALLIADEPTTALDVTVQAQILDLMQELQRETGMSVLLVTHDLGVVAEMAAEVAVMYAGKVVEHAAVETLFGDHRHPYTQGLFESLPMRVAPGTRLRPIEGSVPVASRFPSGCRFRDRCPLAEAVCQRLEPPLVAVTPGHEVACHVRAPADTGRDA